ncbi:MAG: hypothetical protein RL417_1599 [Pseudomonadota bacterium]|jgi:tetratricopeptide (TPR) repeat protein
MNQRIQQLHSFLANRPNDPFMYYALAIEFKNEGNTAEAHRYFEEVYTRFPEYVATYLHFGTLLQEQGSFTEARKIFLEGIEKARDSGDNHALSELSDALALLESEV